MICHCSSAPTSSSRVSSSHRARYRSPKLSASGERVEPLLDAPRRLEVDQAAGDVLDRHLDVVRAQRVGQRRAQLAGLGVDQVHDEGAGVAAEEGVREREVAPVEPLEVQAGHQHRAAVQQAVEQAGPPAAGEQVVVGQRVVEVAGDERRPVRPVPGLASAPPARDADRLDRGQALLPQGQQQAVLALGADAASVSLRA